MKFIYIAVGGGAGSVCRYLLSSAITAAFGPSAFPAGTFTVNACGSFLIGLLWSFSEAGMITTSMGFFLFTGVLGGFTTFSAFSLETVNLFRSGDTITAIVYMLSSNVICIAAACAGFYLAKTLMLK